MRRKSHGFVSLYLLVAGLLSAGFWMVTLVQEHLAQGISTVEKGQLLIAHIIAGLLTAFFALLGGHLLWRRRRTGVFVSFFALGMLTYAGISSLAWGIESNVALAGIFIINAFVSIICFFMLLNAPDIL